MGKTAESKVVKTKRYVKQYFQEFSCNPQNDLYCQLCSTIVRCDKRFHVEQHRQSAKHQKKIAPAKKTLNKQSFVPICQWDFTKKVVTAFLEADIPLYKLQHASIKKLLNSELGKHCPSESACRSHVKELAAKETERLKELFAAKALFLVVDEAEVSGQKYVNILAGLMEEPEKTYLVNCKPLNGNSNSSNICTIVDNTLKNMNIAREKFLLLLSDAARYMIKAAETLKILYPRLLHVTCIAHLLHNCAEHIRAHFKAADNLISSIKAATIKNKDRHALFTAAGLPAPPQPVLTRWATWLEASFYYAENFQIIKNIVDNFEDGGKLVERAKEAIAEPAVFVELRQIYGNYRDIAILIKGITNSSNTIVAASEAIQNLHFGDDPCEIKNYVQSRLARGSDFLKIAAGSGAHLPDHSPAEVALLQRAQPTSASVERSFSILKKMLCPGRNFDKDNVHSYLIMRFNCSK